MRLCGFLTTTHRSAFFNKKNPEYNFQKTHRRIFLSLISLWSKLWHIPQFSLCALLFPVFKHCAPEAVRSRKEKDFLISQISTSLKNNRKRDIQKWRRVVAGLDVELELLRPEEFGSGEDFAVLSFLSDRERHRLVEEAVGDAPCFALKAAIVRNFVCMC